MNEKDNSVLQTEEKPATTSPEEVQQTNSNGTLAEETNETELKLINQKLDAFIKQEYEEEFKDVEFRTKMLELVERLSVEEEVPEDSEQTLLTNPILTEIFKVEDPIMQLQAKEAVSVYADLAIIVFFTGTIGIFIAWKLISLIFNTLLRHIG